MISYIDLFIDFDINCSLKFNLIQFNLINLILFQKKIPKCNFNTSDFES
jgi:hypothetical protein